MKEIVIEMNGETLFEYFSYQTPRIGEFLDISHEYACGLFLVKKVTTRIFQKRDKQVADYVVLEVEKCEE